ncbi:MAG: TatD family hydrolase [Oscillospiraceae bacterium]|nr:TatD family hydrolase [Oscillospiraceae bacterium]
MNNIFDTHSHYTEHDFDEDRNELIPYMHENGVRYIMIAVSNLEDTAKAVKICEQYPYVYCAAGIHPECINNLSDNYIEKIRSAASSGYVKAIGEIGLDYHYEGFNRELMCDVFTKQIILANELGLPVIIHSRDACEDTLNILKKHIPHRGVVHCFSGSPETARQLLDLGLYISFTGVLTFKNARRSVESLKVIPTDRLMLETDCPFMAPVPYRGTRCDSLMIEKTAQKAAEVLNIDTQTLLDITCDNAVKFFNI